MTVPGAVRAIEALTEKMGDEVIIGAGTVLDEATAQACRSAGAQFIVTPSLAMEVIQYCAHNGVVVIPGGLAPTEMVSAWTAGADFVKVFPANAMGGASYIKSLRGPLPQIPLIPTGGVSLQSVGDFILAGAAAVGVGGELVNNNALSNNQDERITECSRQFIEIVAS